MHADKWELNLHKFAPEKYGKYMEFRQKILNNFREYNLPIIELKKDNRKEAVCIVFEKVNTGGVSLSVFELMTATYAADGLNLREEWYGDEDKDVEGYQDLLNKNKLLQDITPTDFLQSCTLLFTYHKRLNDLGKGKKPKQASAVSAKRDAILSLPIDEYNKWKNQLLQGFYRSAKFLKSQSFFSKKDIPYATQLVPLSAVMTLLGDDWQEPKNYDKLARWFWCGVLGELYGGTTDTRLAQDLQDIMTWFEDDSCIPKTVNDSTFRSDRLYSLRSRISAAYKGISTLILRDGAKDFFWRTTIKDLDEDELEESRLDLHHIFPTAWCEKNGIKSKDYNSILNKTPISYKANRMIGGKAPSEYLKQIQKHRNVQISDEQMNEILKTHIIEPSYLRKDDFSGFINDRAGKIIDLIQNVTDKTVIRIEEK